MPTEPRVKGVAFNTIYSCFEELRGAPLRERALELMPAAVRDAYRNHLVLAASWFPISWYREVFKAFRLATGEGPELPRLIGYHAVRKDLASTYKQILIKLVSPQMLLSLSARL